MLSAQESRKGDFLLNLVLIVITSNDTYVLKKQLNVCESEVKHGNVDFEVLVFALAAEHYALALFHLLI